jgi:hypothetical protein
MDLPGNLFSLSQGIRVSLFKNCFILRQLEKVCLPLQSKHIPDEPFRWLPIMKAYEAGTAAYFATPPTNLVYAVHAAMSAITKQSPSLDERLELHREASRDVRKFCTDIGLKLVSCKSTSLCNIAQLRQGPG